MKTVEKEYNVDDDGKTLIFTKNVHKELFYIILGSVLLLAITIYQDRDLAKTVAYVILEIVCILVIIVGRPISIEIDSTGLKFRYKLFPGIIITRFLNKDKFISVNSTPYYFGFLNDKNYISQVRVITNKNGSHTIFSISQDSMSEAQRESDKLATAIANKLGITMRPFTQK